uniref:Uncharacterized protein n=1 Tax=Anguilla anguilla TaxID=7936 RepID=A0A0E9Y119_ANGAN
MNSVLERNLWACSCTDLLDPVDPLSFIQQDLQDNKYFPFYHINNRSRLATLSLSPFINFHYTFFYQWHHYFTKYLVMYITNYIKQGLLTVRKANMFFRSIWSVAME